VPILWLKIVIGTQYIRRAVNDGGGSSTWRSLRHLASWTVPKRRRSPSICQALYFQRPRGYYWAASKKQQIMQWSCDEDSFSFCSIGCSSSWPDDVKKPGIPLISLLRACVRALV